MLITRDIIGNGRGFIYDKTKKPEICRQINRVKNLLWNAGARKGDIVTINIMVVDISHIASIFACAELGMKCFILDSPATKESLPFTKIALHGPSDFHIYSSQEDTTGVYDGLHDEMIKRYGGIGIDFMEEVSDNDFRGELVSHTCLLYKSDAADE